MENLASFQSNGSYVPVTALSQIDLRAKSSGKRWQGLHFELGAQSKWEGDDVMVNGHLITLHTSDAPQAIQFRNENTHEWVSYVRNPGTIGIYPEGRPFSIIVPTYSQWSAAMVDGKFLDAVMGSHHELKAVLNLVDPVIENLLRSLTEELLNPSPHCEVTQSLIHSFVLALASRQGRKAGELPAKSGLSSKRLESLLDWIDIKFATPLTVSVMAARVGLSAAHFSREFKRLTGCSPWEHVVELRLKQACLLLKDGESVSNTALQCGFFDQAHFSRVFKQRFQRSPSVFVRKKL